MYVHLVYNLGKPGEQGPLALLYVYSEQTLQLHLQECTFTDVGTAALADVLTVNNHIHTIDLRGCKGGWFDSWAS